MKSLLVSGRGTKFHLQLTAINFFNIGGKSKTNKLNIVLHLLIFITSWEKCKSFQLHELSAEIRRTLEEIWFIGRRDDLSNAEKQIQLIRPTEARVYGMWCAWTQSIGNKTIEPT